MADSMTVEKIDIGRVIGRGFAVLGRNFLPFLAVALLLSFLPVVFVNYALGEIDFGDGAISLLSPFFQFSTLLAWITSFILQVILIRSSIRQFGGRTPDLAGSAALSLRLLLPMIGLGIVSGLGIVLGMILLIVPGVILYLMWIVAVPVLVEERPGIFASLRRSAELTRGSKGRIFLLLVLFIIVWFVISTVIVSLFGLNPPAPGLTLMALGEALGSTLTALVGAVMIASLYAELKQVREGSDVEELAAIFA